nr:hypothetical protein DA06_24615 [Georgenia sp. SUBG003]
MRVSAHPESGVVVVSLWRSDECVATVRLRPGEAADLASALTASLAELADLADQAPAAHPRAG